MFQPTIKPQPTNTKVCNKCNGTGFYCMGYVNGQPFSQTGFVCYSCNGDGYKPIKKRLTKEEKVQEYKERYEKMQRDINTVHFKGKKEDIDRIISSGNYEGKFLKIIYT